MERHHGTHQDRLIKKMRLAGIADYEAANRYLEEQYLEEHNAKFACQLVAGADFHRHLSKRLDWKWVFCLEAERVVSNDLVVRFENCFLQLKPKRNQGLGGGATVTLEQALRRRAQAPLVLLQPQRSSPAVGRWLAVFIPSVSPIPDELERFR